MPTANELWETINNAALNGGYTSYTPASWSTTSTSITGSSPVLSSSTIPLTSSFGPATISINSSGIYSCIDNTKEELIKELEKVYKHVDELEEDIDYLSNERERVQLELNNLKDKHNKDVTDLTAQICRLKTDNVNFEAKLKALEALVYDHLSKLP